MARAGDQGWWPWTSTAQPDPSKQLITKDLGGRFIVCVVSYKCFEIKISVSWTAGVSRHTSKLAIGQFQASVTDASASFSAIIFSGFTNNIFFFSFEIYSGKMRLENGNYL